MLYSCTFITLFNPINSNFELLDFIFWSMYIFLLLIKIELMQDYQNKEKENDSQYQLFITMCKYYEKVEENYSTDIKYKPFPFDIDFLITSFNHQKVFK